MIYNAPILDVYAAELGQAISTNSFIALVGEYGAGKTHLVREVKRKLAEGTPSGRPVDVIESVDLSDRTVTIASLLRDVIIALGETPMRSSSALSHQAIRLLGMNVRSKRRTNVLVIDDAHRLHPETLAALKRLRERDFCGLAPLLSVVLIGHPSLADTLARRDEIGWRCDVLHLDEDAGWMTPPERVRYLEAVFGDVIAPEARERIAALCRMPEQMNQFVRARLSQARRLGLDVLDERVVRPTTREMKQGLGEDVASVRKIAKAAQLPPTTVQQALTDGDTHPQSDAVRRAIERLAAQTQRNGRFAKAV